MLRTVYSHSVKNKNVFSVLPASCNNVFRICNCNSKNAKKTLNLPKEDIILATFIERYAI